MCKHNLTVVLGAGCVCASTISLSFLLQVVCVKAGRRTGELNFVTAMRTTLAAHYGSQVWVCVIEYECVCVCV